MSVGGTDLHVHSTASDGQDPPEQLAQRARAAGLTVVALTDHDTLDAVAKARDAAAPLGLRVIAGCEFSVNAPWGEMHLLGYFLPDQHGSVRDFLQAQRDGRAARAVEIVARLNRLGIALTNDDVLAEASGGAVGRPHVARALVARGIVPDAQTAFDRFLGFKRPAFVPKDLPAAEFVAALVRTAGGVTSAAHLKDRGTRRNLAWLRDTGVDGVEVVHPAHDSPRMASLEALAAELDLLPTGGSDWHGEPGGEPNRVPLGVVTVPHDWLTALEALHQRRA